jgi:hypothetical protein
MKLSVVLHNGGWGTFQSCRDKHLDERERARTETHSGFVMISTYFNVLKEPSSHVQPQSFAEGGVRQD